MAWSVFPGVPPVCEVKLPADLLTGETFYFVKLRVTSFWAQFTNNASLYGEAPTG